MEFKTIKMATSNANLVHPCCTHRCSLKRRKSNRSKYTSKEFLKGEEHWTKVLQTKDLTAFYKQRCSCRKTQTLNNFIYKRPENSENIISSVFRRFCIWVNGRVHTQHSATRDNSVNIPYTTCRSGSDSGCETDCTTNSHPVLIRTQKLNIDDISINEADDPNYVYIRNNKSGDTSPCTVHVSSAQNSFSNLSDLLNDVNKGGQNFLTLSPGESGSRQNLTVTRSAPSQSQRNSRTTDSVGCKIKPYHTWPLMRKILDQKEEEKDTMFDKLETRHRNPSAEDISTVKEFSIPYEDLEFSTCFRTGRDRVIYRGKWHGDVNIHYYGSHTLLDFWKLVTKMQKVRHENVALFMGTCTDFDRYAIIESLQDGISLYEHIHIRKEVSSMQSKIQLLRQISHGMGYLHAKGIVVKSLNTRNIFLCPKARVSVMDYGIAEPQHDREGLACVPRGYLTYIAPEILRTIMVCPPVLYTDIEYTKEADVFAFGTIVFELVTWRYPFFGQRPELIIWKICTNQCQQMDTINSVRAMKPMDAGLSTNYNTRAKYLYKYCHQLPDTTHLRRIQHKDNHRALIKKLMEMCWSFDPTDRPRFPDISRDLNRTISLNNRHSISEPDILSRTQSISYC